MGISEALNFRCVYSEKDHLFWNELRSHLSVLRRQGLVNEWHEEICENEEKKEVYRLIEGADILIWLISPSFVSSGYLERLPESPDLLEVWAPSEGSRLVPILLSPPQEKSDKWIPQPLQHLLDNLPDRAKPCRVTPGYDDVDQECYALTRAIFLRVLYVTPISAFDTFFPRLDEKEIG